MWGIPVIFGPNNGRFQAAQELLASGGGLEIKDYESFRGIMERLLSDAGYLAGCSKEAGSYVASRAGATDAVLKDVKF